MSHTSDGVCTGTVAVGGLACRACEESLLRRLRQVDGVIEIRADRRRGRVRVTYDPQRVRLEDLEKRLANNGFPPRQGWMNRLRHGWTKHMEQQILSACSTGGEHRV